MTHLRALRASAVHGNQSMDNHNVKECNQPRRRRERGEEVIDLRALRASAVHPANATLEDERAAVDKQLNGYLKELML